MDYEGRVVKLEVNMDALKEELTLLREQIILLDGKVEAFRELTYKRMDDLRDHIDAMRDHIDALRDHTDALRDHIDAARDHTDTLRYHTDRRFDAVHAELVELRRDHTRLIYWVAGFTIANLIATTGWIMKASGVF